MTEGNETRGFEGRGGDGFEKLAGRPLRDCWAVAAGGTSYLRDIVHHYSRQLFYSLVAVCPQRCLSRGFKTLSWYQVWRHGCKGVLAVFIRLNFEESGQDGCGGHKITPLEADGRREIN